MQNLTNYHTNRFLPTYQQIVNSFGEYLEYTATDGNPPLFVLEGTEKLIKEELVRCIWFGQHIKKDALRTDDGLCLEVVSPGKWNLEGGPDFKLAEILLEGEGLIKGSVEIHVFASDWYKHQHNKQEVYNSVCLHVVMWNDTKDKCIRNYAGKPIPQLTLSLYLDAELDDLIDTIDVNSYLKGEKVNPGYCRRELENRKIDELWLGHFLDYAGDERILQKTKRYEKWLKNDPFEQTLYKAIMESLGYKNNKLPFVTLASRMPLETICYLIPEDAPAQEKKLGMQSLLMGMAGLLPSMAISNTMNNDEEGFDYKANVNGVWDIIKTKIHTPAMSKTDWCYAGMRPTNFPERRIAAMSNILSDCASHSIFRHILAAFQKVENYKDRHKVIRPLANDIQAVFLDIYDPFWSHHYTFGSKKSIKPQKLIGKERTSSIFVNVIIPIFLLYARKHNDIKTEELLHLVYNSHKPLTQTSVTKYMNSRIFGGLKTSAKIINSARRQQGLYQIFKDFCENDNVSCDKCALYLSIIKPKT